jgi:penicillin-binding protein 1A
LEEEAAEVARQQSSAEDIEKAVEEALREIKEEHEAMLNMTMEDTVKRETVLKDEHESAMAEMSVENEAAMDNVQEEFQRVLENELERTIKEKNLSKQELEAQLKEAHMGATKKAGEENRRAYEEREGAHAAKLREKGEEQAEALKQMEVRARSKVESVVFRVECVCAHSMPQ